MNKYTQVTFNDLFNTLKTIEEEFNYRFLYSFIGFEVSPSVRLKLIDWDKNVGACLQGAGLEKEKEIWDSRKGNMDNVKTYIATSRSLLYSFLAGVENRNGIRNTPLFDLDIVQTTRPYIEKFAVQANICYENGCYDACIVMLRRLIEVLIIDCFEAYKLQDKIKDSDGHYFFLKDLINRFSEEINFPKSRNICGSLKSLKKLGDIGSHGKNLVQKQDIDQSQKDIRFCIQELISISGLSLKK